jgi:2-keto-myo-inositol isomerase
MSLQISRRNFVRSAGVLTAAAAVPAASPAAGPAADARPSAFRFALNAATLRGQKLSLADQLKTAAEAGYDGYEPWLADLKAHVDTGGSLKDLGRLGADRGLKIVSGIGFANWVVHDDAARARGVEQMKQEMGWLAELGGTHIAAPPAGAYGREMKIELDQAAERYRAILELGRAAGVVPQLEIWGGSANLSHLAEAAYVAAKAGHPDACILADVFHLFRGGSAPAALGLLGRRAVHCLHMNDYPRRRGSRDRQGFRAHLAGRRRGADEGDPRRAGGQPLRSLPLARALQRGLLEAARP